MSTVLDLFLHLDKVLKEVIADYGSQTYALLFFIIFAETGFVVTPFLPGDSLLFAAGLFCNPAQFPDGRPLNLGLVLGLLTTAAILGDTVNYHIGKLFGAQLFKNEQSKVFKRSHLEKTHAFFEKHGGKTIILARFVPIVRTFAPFVAGMGSMTYGKFLLYNVVGGVMWVFLCTLAGYFFGGIPIVRENFSVAVLAIVAISVLPMVFEIVKARREAKLGHADDQGSIPK